MDYTCRNTIIQNMKDFGCDDGTISKFMVCFERNDAIEGKKILDYYRKKLLDDLHRNQKNIDLFDYMVYQLEKCNCK